MSFYLFQFAHYSFQSLIIAALIAIFLLLTVHDREVDVVFILCFVGWLALEFWMALVYGSMAVTHWLLTSLA